MRDAIEMLIFEAKAVHRILELLGPENFVVTKQALLKAIWEAQEQYRRIYRPYEGIERRKDIRQ